MHHRGFRSGQGYPREEERARGTEGGGGAGREGSDSHTLAHAYTHAYVHSMHHVSAGYPRRQGHYRIITYHTYCATTMMARACEHHRQTSPPLLSRGYTYTRTRIPVHVRAFLLTSRAPTSRALTFSYLSVRGFAHVCVRAYRCARTRALAHSLVRRGGDRASARSAAAG